MCGRTSGLVWALGVRECSSPRHASYLRSSPRVSPLRRRLTVGQLPLVHPRARGPADSRVGSAAHAYFERLTCVSKGVNAHIQRFARAPREARRRCAQIADHLARDTALSAFVAEVVCTLGATPPRTVTSPPANGGNCAVRGARLSLAHVEGATKRGELHHYRCDTPTTRRSKAPNAAKPPPLPLVSPSLTGVVLPHQCQAARRGAAKRGELQQ